MCQSAVSASCGSVILSEVEAGLLLFHCDRLGFHSLWITDPLLIGSEQIQTVPPKIQITGKQCFEEITISKLKSVLSKIKNCKDNKNNNKKDDRFVSECLVVPLTVNTDLCLQKGLGLEWCKGHASLHVSRLSGVLITLIFKVCEQIHQICMFTSD